MGIFSKLFNSKPVPKTEKQQPKQAVFIHLNGTDLPQSIYDNNDLMALEDQLIAALDGTGLGEFDGNEIGPEEVVLHIYGTDTEKLFTRIEPVLRNYPLCQQAKVVIRQGIRPGSMQREVML